MRVTSIFFLFFLTPVLLPAAICLASETSQSDQVKKPVAESIDIRRDTQQHEEQWRDDKQKLLARYDQLQQEKRKLTEVKHALEGQVNSTKLRIATKHKQLDDIEQIQTSITPLIAHLIEELQQIVTSDMPYLTDERCKRVSRLVALKNDPEVTVSEKFRKVMEAMLIEVEYGNTIEVYQQTIQTGDHQTLVDIFRLGRIALFFQTLDRKECGFYNVAESTWQPLPASYNRTILSAMEIGAKQRPVELLTLPLGRIRL